jgi:hypothetical protein
LAVAMKLPSGMPHAGIGTAQSEGDDLDLRAGLHHAADFRGHLVRRGRLRRFPTAASAASTTSALRPRPSCACANNAEQTKTAITVNSDAFAFIALLLNPSPSRGRRDYTSRRL